MKKFVVVAGNIGCGKTTLTRELSNRLGFTPSFESVDGNPYLEDFYADMNRWSFPLQIYFLGKRFESHKQIMEGSDSIIQDRSVYEDRAIFAENLRRTGIMTERDYQNYHQIFHLIGQFFHAPDLVVYLRASLPTLQGRIAKRGRDYEANIPVSYLEQLNGLYDEWIGGWKESRIMTLPGDEIDFVANPADMDAIARSVAAELGVPLPAMASA